MIQDVFACEFVSPNDMDILWSLGFRHFGTTFYRYNITEYRDRTVQVIPLRINLPHFSYSRSQKRILQKNSDLQTVFRDAFIDAGKVQLFELHKRRFQENVPDSLSNFFSESPASVPCRAIECCVFHEEKMVAVGFMDIGYISVSSVYTMFDTAMEKRSLGIFMLLTQIQYAKDAGKTYLYHGYAYDQPSFYDYKKKFSALECFEWQGRWRPLKK